MRLQQVVQDTAVSERRTEQPKLQACPCELQGPHCSFPYAGLHGAKVVISGRREQVRGNGVPPRHSQRVCSYVLAPALLCDVDPAALNMCRCCTTHAQHWRRRASRHTMCRYELC